MENEQRDRFLVLFKKKHTIDGKLSDAAIEIIAMARGEWKRLRDEEQNNAS